MMDGVMHGWSDGWMDGWSDGWIKAGEVTYLCLYLLLM